MVIVWEPWSDSALELWKMGGEPSYWLTVDGRTEFNGECLPMGTEASILSWIAERYEIVGELSLFSPRTEMMIFLGTGTYQRRSLTVKRFLVVVNGIEKMFVLHEIIPPERQLGLRRDAFGTKQERGGNSK